jgi:RNA polymerase sigma-70 factor (ECF subfamily)
VQYIEKNAGVSGMNQGFPPPIDKNPELNTMVQKPQTFAIMDKGSSRSEDQELINRLRKGDKSAFREVYARYSQVVFNLALRMLRSREEAEEVVQEIFLQVWNKADSYDSQRGAISTWIVNIARSRSIDKLRTLGYRGQTTELNDFSRIIEDREESRKIIREALDSLPDNQRIAIEMVFFEGLTHIEAAERLNEPVGTIKTRIRLGVAKLKEKISPYIGDLL